MVPPREEPAPGDRSGPRAERRLAADDALHLREDALRSRFTRTFLVSGALTLAGILLCTAGKGATAFGVLFLVFAGPTFAVSAVRHLLRGLLWRVGTRLFVSYLLIGVVPLPFLFGLVLATAAVFSGQLGARRAVDAFTRRTSELERVARDVANGADPAGAAAAFGEDLPGIAAAGAPPGLGDAPRTVVTRRGKEWALVASARTSRGAASVSLPLGPPLAASLSRETGIPVRLLHATTEESGDSPTVHIRTGERKDEEGAASETPPPGGEPPPEGTGLFLARWVAWIAPAPYDVLDAATGKPLADTRAILVVRTSIAGEMKRLFAGAKFGHGSKTDTANIVIVIMKALGVFVLCVYLGASVLSALLVMRIARATRRLSLGMEALERGDFSFRARLPGHDQLAALVEGFNRMAAHLSQSVAERAEREALERELEVARSLQRRLLPPADFTFPGLELAVDFRPAAAIGGDFYHLLPESDSRLSVVIADVSGHGLSTGIVMAAAKASLSALAATGMDAPALLTHLDEEIRKGTDPRTFVTLAHLCFDLAAHRVAYTNAGHLYPYVRRADGRVSSIANPARPLGLGLPATFRTVDAPLETADIWVLVSDGIVEARDLADAQEFGFERLERVLAEGGVETAEAMKERILAAWRAHTGRDEPEDDRTLLVLRVL